MRSPRTVRLPHAGFTLIEVIVAIALFGMVLMGVMGAFLAANNTAANSGTTSRATDLAAQALNVARQMPLEQIGINQADLNVETDGANGTRTIWERTRPNGGAEGDQCAPKGAELIDRSTPLDGTLDDGPEGEQCAVISQAGKLDPLTTVSDGPEEGWVIMRYVNCRPGTPDTDRNRDCIDDEDLIPLPRLVRIKVYKSPSGRPITLSTAITGDEIAPEVPKVAVKSFPAPNKVQSLRAYQSSATQLMINWLPLGGATSYAMSADGDSIGTVNAPNAPYNSGSLQTTLSASQLTICVVAYSVSGTTSDEACTRALTRPGMVRAEWDSGATTVTLAWNPAAITPGVAGYAVERRRRPSEPGDQVWVRVSDANALIPDNIFADPDGTCMDMYRVRAYLTQDDLHAPNAIDSATGEGTRFATSMTAPVSGC